LVMGPIGGVDARRPVSLLLSEQADVLAWFGSEKRRQPVKDIIRQTHAGLGLATSWVLAMRRWRSF
jgi:hypothetical protein